MSETGRRGRRSGRWLALAGIIFVVTFVVALVLLAQVPGVDASSQDVSAFYSSSTNRNVVLAGAYLAAISGLVFFWFMGVLRSREGATRREQDVFGATIVAAGGTVFVACLFVSAAAIATPAASVTFLGFAGQASTFAQLLQEFAYGILYVYGSRAAAAFIIFTSRLALGTQSLPRWLGIGGMLLGVALLVIISYNPAILLVLPLWVAIVSVYALLRPMLPQP